MTKRTAKLTACTLPAAELISTDYAANLAFFLQANTGSIFGRWQGHMSAANQRLLYGRFFGKGLLTIDGNVERVTHTRKVCFGLDIDRTCDLTWRDLEVRPDVLWS